jgi:hypothetical protein
MDNAPGRPDQQGIPTRGIAEILQAGFELYQKHWKELMSLAAGVVVPITLVQYFLLDRLSPTVKVVVQNGRLALQYSNGFIRRELVIAAFFFLTILLYQVLTAAITRAVAGEAVGTSFSLEDSYRFGLSRLGPILLVGILAGLAVAGGLILFFIPGVWIAVRLSVSTPSLVVENKRGTAALSRSWNLVRGMWWQVFGVFFVAGLIGGVVSAVVALPFGHNWFLRSIGAMIGSIITLPFSTTVLVLVYLDLRVRKENLDVARLRSELEASGI